MGEKSASTNLNSILFKKDKFKIIKKCLNMSSLPLSPRSRQEMLSLCFRSLNFLQFLR